MRFVTQRDAIQKAVSIVSRAVPSRSTVPVMSNILLEADAEGLTLSATDHEIAIVAQVRVNTEEAGRTTIPAKVFTQAVAVQSAGLPLTIDADNDGHVTFYCGPKEMQLNGLTATDFPPIPRLSADVETDGLDEHGTPVVKSSAHFQVASKVLRPLIEECVIAISNDETRARMTGMLFTRENERLRTVATDTHRLATMSVPIDFNNDAEIEAIIPGMALDQVVKLTGMNDTPVVVDLTDAQVQFTIGDLSVSARLIDGEFPGYRSVIPSRSDWRIEVSRDQLAECVASCQVVTTVDENSKIRFIIERVGEMGVLSQSAALGKCANTIRDVGVTVEEHVADERLNMCFNGNYVRDVLNVLKSDSVILQFTKVGRPGVIRPADFESDYIYVLMPMQDSEASDGK